MAKIFLILLKSYSRSNKNCFKKNKSKTAEATGALIGNDIADEITNVLKKSSRELQNNEANDGTEI